MQLKWVWIYFLNPPSSHLSILWIKVAYKGQKNNFPSKKAKDVQEFGKKKNSTSVNKLNKKKKSHISLQIKRGKTHLGLSNSHYHKVYRFISLLNILLNWCLSFLQRSIYLFRFSGEIWPKTFSWDSPINQKYSNIFQLSIKYIILC